MRNLRQKLLSVFMAAAVCVCFVPQTGLEVAASESIWQSVTWSNGKPMHEKSKDNWEYHTPIYHDEHVRRFQLDPEMYPNSYDNYHGGKATCADCGATAIIYEYEWHNFNNSETTCDECGYHPKYYVTIKYTLADGVQAPAGFVEEEKAGPFERGQSYTAYAKSYNDEGLSVRRTSGYSSGTAYGDTTVEYEYYYRDPCPNGKNHDWNWEKVDDETHELRCSKCKQVKQSGSHDKFGDSNKSWDVCQVACSYKCGYKKTFVAHNFEKYEMSEDKVFWECKNCGFITQCMHEWETEEFQQEGDEHVRVCKLCGYEDKHSIDCEGSWRNVATPEICRLPCCRRCKQAVLDFSYSTEDMHEYCHDLHVESNGTPDTHNVYCSHCGWEVKNAPCFDPTDLFFDLPDDIDLEEMERFRIGGEYFKIDSKNGTMTQTCACGNKRTVKLDGMIVDESGNKVDLKDFEGDGYEHIFVSTEPQDMTEEEYQKLKGILTTSDAVRDRLIEWGVKSVDDLDFFVFGEPSEVKYVEETKTEGEGDDKVQTAKVEITKGYGIRVTDGNGHYFEMKDDQRIYSSYPVNISIPCPEGFGKDGDIVKVDHQHDGKEYTYYGKVTTYEGDKCITFTSEHGLSPFTFTISKAVDKEYREYLMDKLTQNGGTITFSANATSVSGTMDTLTIPETNSVTLTKNAFTRTGFEFTGWNTMPDGSGVSYADGANVSLFGNVTLYAQWKIKSDDFRYEQSENDVAAVTFRYYLNNGDSDPKVYKTAYFSSLQDAVTAADMTPDYLDKLSSEEQNLFTGYAHGKVTLLKDVEVSDTLRFGEHSEQFDLNGHTLTVTKSGRLVGSNGYGEILFESEKPGTFSSCGTINIGISTWTGDTLNFTGGKMTRYLGVDGGTINVSGGEFSDVFVNNGGAADIKFTVSGNAKLNNFGFVVYTDGNGNLENGKKDIHLYLKGGYFTVDPAAFRKGYMGQGEFDQSKFVTFDDDKAERYESQTDWAADTKVYTYRIKPTVVKGNLKGGENTKITAEDVTLLITAILNHNAEEKYGESAGMVADMDGNGKIDGIDLIMLRRSSVN